MKALQNNVLIYDGDCPMCRMYSHAFVKAKMLEPSGIQSYNNMTATVKNEINVDRARNEIALVDTSKHSVVYGIDSWLKIFSYHFPVMAFLTRFKPFYSLLKGLYLFISYNRRVIAPGKQLHKGGSCDPDYNIKWRWIYIGVSSLLIAILLHVYLKSIPLYADQQIRVWHEWLIVAVQLITQGIFVYFIHRKRVLHYFGQLMTISLIGGLLLIPAIVLHYAVTSFQGLLYTSYFIFPVTVMLWQHLKRTKMLELPLLLTFTWILYRLLLLAGFLFYANIISL